MKILVTGHRGYIGPHHSTRMSQIWALVRALKKQPTELLQNARYFGDRTLDLVNPVSAYAISKVDSEAGLSELADRYFSPVYLRNARLRTHSPCLRIDLVVDNLLACALARGDIRIMSDGTPWRPLIHCGRGPTKLSREL